MGYNYMINTVVIRVPGCEHTWLMAIIVNICAIIMVLTINKYKIIKRILL